MMRQYRRIKASYPDAIVFFRLGDFYEMFFEDAELASGILDITLTARHRGTPSEAPMCGVPHHSADGYLARLLAAGQKVAIAEQVESAAESKGMVRREVVRVLTPGTLVEEELLESRANNYLVAVQEQGGRIGVAAIDVSTGHFLATELEGADAIARAVEEIARFAPREICHPEAGDATWLQSGVGTARPVEGVKTWSPTPAWTWDAEQGEARLREHFGVATLAGFDLDECPAAIGAAGALLHYVGESQKAPITHIRTIRRVRDRESLQLDASTRRSLELTESWQGGTRAGSLLAVLDRSATAMGGRRLREWLLRPLIDPEAIAQRADVVERLHREVRLRDRLHDSLRAVHDLERLTARVSLGRANPRDLHAMRVSLEALPDCGVALNELAPAELAAELAGRFDPCGDVSELIAEQLCDEPPARLGTGSVIREGFHAELDRLRRARSDGKGFIAELEARERERTGIGSLKVGYNKVFGYFLEVSRANLARVPTEFVRKQTLTNAERFITEELKEFEETVLGAEDKIATLEEELFLALRARVADQVERLRNSAEVVAILDALGSLAEVAARNGYVRPRVDAGGTLEIRAGRHPVVEALQPDVLFVPNDAYLDDRDHQIKLVTGPNMGGKSTYLRQIALLVIMAQMGGFVPADFARVGVVDRIFTRVGASDNLARGASTFLVEMQETANILNNATPRSLVLLDEVGRGTSTYDGLSLAWSVVEYLHDRPSSAARTLFATHYHELTQLEGRLGGLSNLNVTVHESGEGVVFLHRVEPGAADRSYGIHVARLAGLPAEVVHRAETILEDLEGRSAAAVGPPARSVPPRTQMGLFEPPEHPLAERLRSLHPDTMTPIEALGLLARWRAEFGGQEDE